MVEEAVRLLELVQVVDDLACGAVEVLGVARGPVGLVWTMVTMYMSSTQRRVWGVRPALAASATVMESGCNIPGQVVGDGSSGCSHWRSAMRWAIVR